MTVSYAQNFEDIMLLRALRSVEHGFYVDVGADWPDQDSVTKLFSDRGWWGINIEPNPALFDLLAKSRPRDVNLQCAAGTVEGSMTLELLPDTGLSTLDPALAENYRNQGQEVVHHDVDVLRLETILARHVPEEQEIHFLKIDVEGFESSVIEGNNWTVNRPWIVLVEATRPTTQEVSVPWEPRILEQGYRFVYFDGLNRFYVAEEHADLTSTFERPPNVFDGFISAAHRSAEDRATMLEIQLIEATHKADVLDDELNRSRAEATWLRNERARAERLEDEARLLRAEMTMVRGEYAAANARAEAARAGRLATQRELGSVQVRLADTVHALEQHGAYNSQLLEHIANLDRHIGDMYASTSWRASRPIRFVGLLVRDPGALIRRLRRQSTPSATELSAGSTPSPQQIPTSSAEVVAADGQPWSSDEGFEDSATQAIARSVLLWSGQVPR
jgi:FkbM family methyltransferase